MSKLERILPGIFDTETRVVVTIARVTFIKAGAVTKAVVDNQAVTVTKDEMLYTKAKVVRHDLEFLILNLELRYQI